MSFANNIEVDQASYFLTRRLIILINCLPNFSIDLSPNDLDHSTYICLSLEIVTIYVHEILFLEDAHMTLLDSILYNNYIINRRRVIQ